jgi:pimeloyl-ACP methyl ester carboxylesterase
MSELSLPFHESRETGKTSLARSETLNARDGVTLSYRRYVPASPRAVVLFYHAGGAHSGAGYQSLGNGLKTQYDTVVYTPDLRGHGASEGPRGDAPRPEQVWEDVTTLIQHARTEYPQLPLFLGGHSSGAGLVLNYASHPGHESVSGYLFLSPQFSNRSPRERLAPITPFARADSAVRFNYPAESLASDTGLVPAITVNMSNALTPPAPFEQLAALDGPFGLWVGGDDELFLSDSVLSAVFLRLEPQASSVPTAKYLSVLIRAHETIGPWIMEIMSKKQN